LFGRSWIDIVITELTTAQKELWALRYNERLRDAKSSEPLDRAAVDRLAQQFYRLLGRPQPRIVCLPSPAMCVLAWGRLSGLLHGSHRRFTGPLAAVWEQLPEQLDRQLSRAEQRDLRKHLGYGLARSLRGEQQRLASEIESQIRDTITPELWHEFGASVRSKDLEALLSRIPRSPISPATRDGLESRWSLVEYSRLADADRWIASAERLLHAQLHRQTEEQVPGLGIVLDNCSSPDSFSLREVLHSFAVEIGVPCSSEQKQQIDLYSASVRHLHYWFPFGSVVLASERHTLPLINEKGQVHAAEGPVLSYPDGWSVYAWRGIPIPWRYADPTAMEIPKEPNAEVRRAVMERFEHAHGKGSFILNCGARLLDSAVQPMWRGRRDQINELLAIDLPDDAAERMVCLRVICPSTGNQYVLGVDKDMQRVRQAIAWTFGMTEEEYVLAQET
jgi:hypothetical protein